MERPRPDNRFSPIRLFNRPVDSSLLGAYRMVFGACVVLFVFRYSPSEALLTKYAYPDFFFSFSPFAWLRLPVLPPVALFYFFTLLGVAGFALAAGLRTRWSAAFVFAAMLYLLLLEKSYVPDPYYLYVLVAGLMIFLDGGGWASLDARLNPAARRDTLPFLQVFLLRAQFVLVYFYSGLSKLLTPDFLKGRPMHLWLAPLTGTPVVGALFAQPWFAALLSIGGMLFDLSVGPLLLCRKTRPLAVGLAVIFHGFNKWALDLDLVPWFVLAGTVVFFEPDTPRRRPPFARPGRSP